MKKKWTVFSAWLLLVSSCLGCAPGFYETEPTLDAEAAREILDTYEAEVRMVEKMFGADLSDHTAEAYELLTEAAITQYGTEQFDRISQLVANLTAAAWNQTEEGARGKSHAYTVAKPFGPLKGVCFWEVPVGCSMAGDLTGTVEIARGELVGDLEISDPVSVEIPLDQADGPADRTTLPDGATVATHRIFTGVLWGVILEGPGEAEYRIACPRGVGYAHLAQIASPAYVERAVDHTVVTCEHMLDLQQVLETDPGRFLAAPVTSEEVEPTDAGSME